MSRNRKNAREKVKEEKKRERECQGIEKNTKKERTRINSTATA
jgi:hypothetical protein